MTFKALESLAREAVSCRVCFDDLTVQAPLVNLAQPRYVGPKYWSTKPRVAIVMLNPGGGESYSELTAKRLVNLLEGFRANSVSLTALFDQQREDMPNWGKGENRFFNFYLRGLGLRLDNIAFANIAWCATRGDKYPRQMLDGCFSRHTGRLLQILEPDIVVLSGSSGHRFQRPIQESLPKARVVCTLHYANRKSAAVEQAALSPIRDLIQAAAAAAAHTE